MTLATNFDEFFSCLRVAGDIAQWNLDGMHSHIAHDLFAIETAWFNEQFKFVSTFHKDSNLVFSSMIAMECRAERGNVSNGAMIDMVKDATLPSWLSTRTEQYSINSFQVVK